jgi:GNAT superfamily N-acetyltransferase
MVHLLPQPGFELHEQPELVLITGGVVGHAQRLRLRDVEQAVESVRAEARRRRLGRVEWWIGWSAEPHDARDRLLRLGLTPDEVPTLTGMTSTVEPPPVDGVDVRRVESLEDMLATLAVDWQVWNTPQEERDAQERRQIEHWEAACAAGAAHHFAAFLDGRRVGFARSVYTESAVVLLGGAVLPEARGNGVYRALVRARWEDALARGTPTLVVQAGAMSGPVLERLGFVATARSGCS